MTFKRFTKEDWYGWAGCSPFPNGDDPLIATVPYRHPTKPECSVIVIVGGEEPGIVELNVLDKDGEDLGIYQVSGAAALNVLVQIHALEWLDMSIIAALGFNRIN